MHAPRIALIAATAIVALYGAGLYFEQNIAGPSCCGLTWPTPDPAQAERLMVNEDPKGSIAAVQRRVAVSLLAARPMESNAWLRLAYADRLNNGHLTDAGRHAVEMSYLVLPFASSQTPWRLDFAFENWGELSPQSRKDVIAEVGIAKNDPEILNALTTAAGRVHNPSGRLAAGLLLTP